MCLEACFWNDSVKLTVSAVTTADSCSKAANIKAIFSQGFSATVYYRSLIICQKYLVSKQMLIIAFTILRIMS